jgi:hypothetical protein
MLLFGSDIIYDHYYYLPALKTGGKVVVRFIGDSFFKSVGVLVVAVVELVVAVVV